MKRSFLKTDEISFPEEVRGLIREAEIYDSSCSPEARVFYIARDGGYFLKRAGRGTLLDEAEMTRYFHGKGLGAEVLLYKADEYDWLLTRRIEGEDCTHFVDCPRLLCDRLALSLRALHECSFEGCPRPLRTSSYLALAKKNYMNGCYDTSLFDKNYSFASADDAYRALSECKEGLISDVLIHGDYCLPNIILLKNYSLSGFIDLGNGGVANRHIDLFWGAWSLFYNLKTDEYRGRFFDAYGRDKIDPLLLRAVAAAECFG